MRTVYNSQHINDEIFYKFAAITEYFIQLEELIIT